MKARVFLPGLSAMMFAVVFIAFVESVSAAGVCSSEVRNFDRRASSAQKVVVASSSVFKQCRQGMFASSLSDFNNDVNEKRKLIKSLTSTMRNGNSSQRCQALRKYNSEEQKISNILNKVRSNFEKYGSYFDSAIRKMSTMDSPRVCGDYNGNMQRIEQLKNHHLNQVIRGFLGLRDCMASVRSQMSCR